MSHISYHISKEWDGKAVKVVFPRNKFFNQIVAMT